MIDDNFDILFRRQGFRNFTYQSEMVIDPQVLSQRWIHPPHGAEYLGDEFYHRFGQNTFRKLLGRIYTTPGGVTYKWLMETCGNTEVLDHHLTFMRDQELVVEEGDRVTKAPNWKHVNDLGRTLEWYIARWFQTALMCPARYGVHVPGIAGGGDLDVVAFMDGLRIWVECKSGRGITDTQLRLFRERAADFTPVMAILLIDTDDTKAMTQYVKRLDTFGLSGYPFELKNEREALYWRGRPLYAVGVPNSIEESLQAALRLYHDYVRFVPFVG